MQELRLCPHEFVQLRTACVKLNVCKAEDVGCFEIAGCVWFWCGFCPADNFFLVEILVSSRVRACVRTRRTSRSTDSR